MSVRVNIIRTPGKNPNGIQKPSLISQEAWHVKGIVTWLPVIRFRSSKELNNGS
jgi:hypothetical protein